MRLAKLSYQQLTPEQKVVWDEVVAGPRKKMHGPFFIWLHSPDLLSRGEKLGLYARFQSSLPQRLRALHPDAGVALEGGGRVDRSRADRDEARCRRGRAGEFAQGASGEVHA